MSNQRSRQVFPILDISPELAQKLSELGVDIEKERAEALQKQMKIEYELLKKRLDP